MEHCTTTGVDVSDRTSKICVMTKAEGGERRIVVETTCATTKACFEEAFAKFDRGWPVAFETGTHCRWMERHIRSLGFRAIVANPAKARISGDPTSKNDRNDARGLARLALADPALLFPVRLRSESSRRMLRLHESRQMPRPCASCVTSRMPPRGDSPLLAEEATCRYTFNSSRSVVNP